MINGTDEDRAAPRPAADDAATARVSTGARLLHVLLAGTALLVVIWFVRYEIAYRAIRWSNY